MCGVRLRRLTLPNGKRAFEEEGVIALLIGDTKPATQADLARFQDFALTTAH